MILTFTFAWWWIGVAGLAIGLLLTVASPTERGSGGMLPFDSPGPAGCIGIILAVCSTFYLLFGWIARMLP